MERAKDAWKERGKEKKCGKKKKVWEKKGGVKLLFFLFFLKPNEECYWYNPNWDVDPTTFGFKG